MKIGVISDTHGVLREVALEALAGSDLIIHAGDVGTHAVLDRLRSVAPLVAVRGNCDKGALGESLPETRLVQLEGIGIFVLHDLKTLPAHPHPEGVRCIISGHTHRALQRSEGGILYLNPGSAGPRRFSLPLTVALLHVTVGELAAEVIDLKLTSEGGS